MKQGEFLGTPPVASFVAWAGDFVAGRRRLKRRWYSPQGPGFTFECGSLREACEKYRWPMVGESKGFDETAGLFDRWQRTMADRGVWQSPAAGLPDRFRHTAIEVTRWGRMPQVRDDLERMGPSEMDVLFANARLLDPDRGDADVKMLKAGGIRYMNSGYSKIYAMMLKSFPIYDSRVACALTSLVRAYCVEYGLDQVPEPLRLGVLSGRGDAVRNPSDESYRFVVIGGGGDYRRTRHASSNLRAAWLLKELADREGRNGGWPEGHEALALQSALFMVGYEVFGTEALEG